MEYPDMKKKLLAKSGGHTLHSQPKEKYLKPALSSMMNLDICWGLP
jgi:hypothetical protein